MVVTLSCYVLGLHLGGLGLRWLRGARRLCLRPALSHQQHEGAGSSTPTLKPALGSQLEQLE